MSFDPPPAKSTLLPPGRLSYIPLEQIIGGDICRLVSTSRPQSFYPFTNYRLNSIYTYLQRILSDVKVSLLVLIRGTNTRQLSNFDGEQKIRFAFIDDELTAPINDLKFCKNERETIIKLTGHISSILERNFSPSLTEKALFMLS
uniref:Uncharacterized protein n=1 Tax=Parascaris equorum TaxID=6256 RepID=A0A914RFS9_PAREQ